MILVTVLFVGLRDDVPEALLLLPLLDHPSMNRPAPLLKGGEIEPLGLSVLMDTIPRMACRQVFVGIPRLYQPAHFMRPGVIAEAVQVVTEIPGDV